MEKKVLITGDENEVEQVVRTIEKLPRAVRKAAVPEAREKPVACAYFMARFDESVDLPALYQRLHLQEKILCCDATRGDYDLILLLHGDSPEQIREMIEKQIMTIPGLNDTALLPVEFPAFEDRSTAVRGSADSSPECGEAENPADGGRDPLLSATSYLTLEIEQEKLEATYSSLCGNERIVSCDCTRGKYDMVVLLRGNSFSHIDRIIETQIRPLDGVLRIKECPVIKLYEM